MVGRKVAGASLVTVWRGMTSRTVPGPMPAAGLDQTRGRDITRDEAVVRGAAAGKWGGAPMGTDRILDLQVDALQDGANVDSRLAALPGSTWTPRAPTTERHWANLRPYTGECAGCGA